MRLYGTDIKRQQNLFEKALATNYLQFAIVALSGLWLTPYVLTFLTKAEYGVFAVFIDLIAWMKLVEITNGVTQSKLAHYYATKDLKEAVSLTASAFWSQVAAALFIVMLSLFVMFNFSLFIDLPSSIAHLKVAFMLVAIASAVDLSTQTFSAIIVASKRIYVDNLINILMFLFRIGLMVLLLEEGYKILSLAIANLIVSFLTAFIKLHRVKSMGHLFSIRLKDISKDKILFLYRNGRWFSLGSLAGLLIFNIDKIMAGKMLGLEYVTIYIITLKLYDLTEKLLSKSIGISRPFIAQLYAKKEYFKLKELFVFMDQFYTFLAWGLGFVVLIVSADFIRWWVGSDLYGGDLLSFLMFVNFSLQAMVMPKRAFLAATLFEVKNQNIVRLFEGVVNVLLSIILIHYFELAGLLAASVLATLFGSNITYSYFVRRLLSTNGFAVHYPTIFWFPLMILFGGSAYLLYVGALHTYLYVGMLYVIYIVAVALYIRSFLSQNDYSRLAMKRLATLVGRSR